MNKRKTGAKYEKQAADYLERQGVEILARNYRNRKGEIDLIGRDSEYTVFLKLNTAETTPKELQKKRFIMANRKNICMVADYYRMIHQMGEFVPIRYDVIAICGEEITWHKNAFAHIYSDRG